MKIILSIILFVTVVVYVEGIQDYLGQPEYECIKCLCHARTGCYRRKNCADYSISMDYWKTAGRLSPQNRYGDSEYYACIKDENCIVGTIVEYINKIGHLDCNCDDKYDCKDTFAIHLFGRNCTNPKYGETYAKRFNDCAAKIHVSTMLPAEGNENCRLPDIE